jgi:orotidine-5'-phosphate decarboxylase
MKGRLIVALDVRTLQQAKALVDKLYPTVKIFKIGNQLFTQAGPEAVSIISRKRGKVFLDLKFHDIPNTVSSAIKNACAMGVHIVNLHASGGAEMMKAAVKARGTRKTPLLLAVTMLTSIDKKEMHNIGMPRTTLSQVKRLALLARKCGMDGVVCSGQEVDIVRRACGRDFVVLVPGVRPAGVQTQDQKRVVTPAFAASKGVDYIVVGRPITKSRHPLKAAQQINSVLQVS